MKKSILVTLLTVLLICTACGQSSPEKALDNYLKEMISTAKCRKAIRTTFDLSAFLQKVEYDITGSTVNDDTAEVYITLSTPDLSGVLQELIVQAFASAFSGSDEADSDTIMQKVIDEKITSPDTAIVTKSVTVYMVKTEDAWVLAEEGNETFLSALMGGLVSNVYSADHFADVGKLVPARYN